MKSSEGVTHGRIAELYNPGRFREGEEVIVFKREDLARTFTAIRKQINACNKIGFSLDRSEEWKLIGYWPRIMKNVHMINLHTDLLFKKEPLQSHLDSYLYENIPSSGKEIVVCENKAINNLLLGGK